MGNPCRNHTHRNHHSTGATTFAPPLSECDQRSGTSIQLRIGLLKPQYIRPYRLLPSPSLRSHPQNYPPLYTNRSISTHNPSVVRRPGEFSTARHESEVLDFHRTVLTLQGRGRISPGTVNPLGCNDPISLPQTTKFTANGWGINQYRRNPLTSNYNMDMPH